MSPEPLAIQGVPNKMTYSTWKLCDGALYLVAADGAAVQPSASEIFSVVFEGATSIRGLTVDCKPGQVLSDLKFSRFPAEIAVRILGQVPESLEAEFGVKVKGRFVPMSHRGDQVVVDGRWYPIDSAAWEAMSLWFQSAEISIPGKLTLGHLISLRTSVSLPFVLIDESRACDIGHYVLPKVALKGTVEGLNATLYPYQEVGIGFLSIVAEQGVGCILGDEMGLGKTLQIIGLLVHEKCKGNSPFLVIAPATLLENWRRELAIFAPGLTSTIHAGGGRTGIVDALHDFDVVITSYDIAVRDELLLSCVKWYVVALDEAQNIKNPEALRTLAVKRLPRRVSVAVTGTPVENRLDDLWSISDFALPGLLGTLAEFRSTFSDDVGDASRLAHIVSPILIRRKVTDVAKDLPPRIDIPQPVEMGPDLAQTYETVRLETLEAYGPAGGLVATTRLRLFCTHPSLAGYGSAANKPEEYPKYMRLLEILDEVFSVGEKALVFTTYHEMIDLFMADIPQRWQRGLFSYIDGRIPIAERQPAVDRFFEHLGYGVMFLNPKAAGTGLNITAANHVIHFNPEWNPALTDQATARAYRRRQTRPVTIHNLFYADTIEEVVIGRAQFKRELASGAVSGHVGDIDAASIARALQVSPLSRYGGSTE